MDDAKDLGPLPPPVAAALASGGGPSSIRRIPAVATHPLRQRVLRPGLPPSSSRYAFDDDPRALHLGAYLDDELVAVGTVAPEDRGKGPAGGFRIRGMATDPRYRRRGFGRALLTGLVAWGDAKGATEVWCNARIGAVEVYRREGFEVCSDRFELPDIGPHVVMTRSIELSPVEVRHR